MIWALVALTAADNSVDTLKESMSRQENEEAVGVCDDDWDESDEEENKDEYEDTAEEDKSKFGVVSLLWLHWMQGNLLSESRTFASYQQLWQPVAHTIENKQEYLNILGNIFRIEIYFSGILIAPDHYWQI